MPSLRAVPQHSIYETTVEDAELERALEARESLREDAAAARHNLKVADDSAKAMIEERLELGEDVVVRVGRFLVGRRRIKARHVSFETEASERISIRRMREE